MCLTISVEAVAAERDKLVAAATAASGCGLNLRVEHVSRWQWAKNRPARVFVSDGGGCACDLLSDQADWNAETWTMRPEVVEALAQTLETLIQHCPTQLAIEALWAGDHPEENLAVRPDELAAIVRGKGLGTKTRYTVRRGE